MTKIPVLQITTAAYEFTFENYVKLLGIVWAPAVLSVAVTVWQFGPMMAAVQNIVATRNPAGLAGMFGHVLVIEAVGIAALVITSVGITRLALGREVKWPFFYFALGSEFWRLLLATILIALILLVGTIIASIVLGLVIAAVSVSTGSTIGQPQANPITTLAITIFIYAVMISLCIRLGFLLPSIVTTEKRIGLGRNWMLTRGNFWRIFALVILTLLPLLALAILEYLLMAWLDIPIMPTNPGNPVAGMANSMRMMTMFAQYWFILLPAGFLLMPIVYGPLLNASTRAYQTLVPETADPAGVF